MRKGKGKHAVVTMSTTTSFISSNTTPSITYLTTSHLDRVTQVRSPASNLSSQELRKEYALEYCNPTVQNVHFRCMFSFQPNKLRYSGAGRA